MSGITGVGHVVLWVRDEVAFADFYRDVLGMEVMCPSRARPTTRRTAAST